MASITTNKINEVRAQILLCQSCGLSKGCRSPIPLSTNTGNPKFIIVGEAPGQYEDRHGEPFIGPAGQFLRRSLRHAGLRPSEGAWMNAVSCYPASERTPDDSHVAACRHNLYDQLDLLPEGLPTMLCGRIALTALLPSASLGYVTGTSIPAHGKTLYPVYHPAYILRQQRSIMDSWDRDMRGFAKLVDGDTKFSDRPHCIYCNTLRYPGAVVCPKHASQFTKDCKRKARPAPPQPSLFE